jgi:hypothetical protein
MPCPWEGFVRHAGKMFSPFAYPGKVNHGIPLTARGDVTGPTGGYGWIIRFNKTAPRSIYFRQIEISPESMTLISIPYPVGTSFQIRSLSSDWCQDELPYFCNATFTSVSSLTEVRNGPGNTYYVDTKGVLTFRLAQTGYLYSRKPEFVLPNYTTVARHPENEFWALARFERSGLRLPRLHLSQRYHLQAKCPGDTSSSPKNGYCSQTVLTNYDPDVCPTGYIQVAYDKCCQIRQPSRCVFANG